MAIWRAKPGTSVNRNAQDAGPSGGNVIQVIASLVMMAVALRFSISLSPMFLILAATPARKKRGRIPARRWELGDPPSKSMVQLLEGGGVHVHSLALDAAEVDALSTWREERPFVFLKCKRSSERARFDETHELGHLVLHR